MVVAKVDSKSITDFLGEPFWHADTHCAAWKSYAFAALLDL